MFLFIRVFDMDAAQEPSVIRRIHCQIGIRLRCIYCCFSETLFPTIRERFHGTHVSAAPWTSPVNHEFMVCREAERRYSFRYSTTFTGQRQCAVFHFRHPVYRLSASQSPL